MRGHNVNTWKTMLSKVMIAVLVMVSLLIVPNNTTEAAATPTLTKSTQTILIGATYDLNIKNWIKGSTYSWTSSKKSIATVNSKGVVKGIAKGTAVITCTLKAPKKTYKLKCTVTIRKGATSFKINNKVTALNVGQYYDINRTLTPSTSNDLTTWISSNRAIAAPDALGRFTALKVGTVKITGKTISGKSDSVTIKVVDKYGTVTNQTELNALLGSGVATITIKTDAVADFTIPSGNYPKTKLVVDAPNADVHNNAVFASVDIKQIAANSWYENAVGNTLNVLAANSRIVVAENANVKITVKTNGANVAIENNGVIQQVAVQQLADINITGTSTAEIPVIVSVENTSITTSVPLNLNLTQKIKLVLLAGSEATKIQAATTEVIPDITGNSPITVTVGTGENTTQQEVIPTPLPDENDDVNDDVIKTVNEDGSVSYTLAQPYTDLTAIVVTSNGITYSVDGATLATLKLFLANDTAAISLWKATTDTTNTYSEQNVTVTGEAGSSTKVVSFTGGELDGKSYTVTVGTDNTVSITSQTSDTTFTLTMVDNYTLKINADNSDLTFAPSFN